MKNNIPLWRDCFFLKEAQSLQEEDKICESKQFQVYTQTIVIIA